MRVAVISDVHGNREALEAVLADVEGERPDALWCLGDLVGYGPHPNECCAIVAERADVCLVGNHDLVALDISEVDVEEFNPEAAAAALWTRDELGPDAVSFLRSLQSSATVEQVELYHASPRDPVWEYVLTTDAAAAAFRVSTAPLVLVGHSHVALALSDAGAGSVAGGPRPRGPSRPSRDGGCSIPARSASPATATRAPPGCSSTSAGGLPASAAFHIPCRRRRRRSAGAACPSRWPRGWPSDGRRRRTERRWQS